MVVRMHIEHDERAAGRQTIKLRGERSIEVVVDDERRLHLGIGEAVGPHIKAPGVVRAEVHRGVTRSVEIDLEPGTPHDHLGSHVTE